MVFVEPDLSVPSFTCPYEKIREMIQEQLVQKMVLMSKKLRVSEKCPTNMMDRFVKTINVQLGLGAVPNQEYVPHKRKRVVDEADAIEEDEEQASMCAHCGQQKLHNRSHATYVCDNSVCPQYGIVMPMSLNAQQHKIYKMDRIYQRFPGGNRRRKQKGTTDDGDKAAVAAASSSSLAPKRRSRNMTAYKRPTHMRDVIQRAQGKQSTVIDDYVFEIILQDLAKERIEDRTTVSQQDVLDILKRNGLVKWYVHYIKIHWELTGIQPWQLTEYEEQELYDSFEIVQKFFDQCRADRSSMWSYKYIAHKRCEILAHQEPGTEQAYRWRRAQQIFHLLKGDSRLADLDESWRKLCAMVGWPFFPTYNFY